MGKRKRKNKKYKINLRQKKKRKKRVSLSKIHSLQITMSDTEGTSTPSLPLMATFLSKHGHSSGLKRRRWCELTMLPGLTSGMLTTSRRKKGIRKKEFVLNESTTLHLHNDHKFTITNSSRHPLTLSSRSKSTIHTWYRMLVSAQRRIAATAATRDTAEAGATLSSDEDTEEAMGPQQEPPPYTLRPTESQERMVSPPPPPYIESFVRFFPDAEVVPVASWLPHNLSERRRPSVPLAIFCL